MNLAFPKFNFLLRSPQLFCSEIFRSPPKIGGGGGWALLPCYSLLSKTYRSSPVASTKLASLKSLLINLLIKNQQKTDYYIINEICTSYRN